MGICKDVDELGDPHLQPVGIGFGEERILPISGKGINVKLRARHAEARRRLEMLTC